MTKPDFFTKITKNELLKRGFFMVGYELYYNRLSRIISKKGTNNALIVGEDGVGKTRLALGLGFNGGYELLQLETEVLSELIFSYQVDKTEINAIKKTFKELKKSIVFIDDISLLFSHEQLFSQRFINLLRLLLDNPNISVVATIDQSSFRQYVEKNPLISKSFELIRIQEPNSEVSNLIIQNYLPYFEKNYEIAIPDSLSEQLISLSDRYIHSKKQPAKALNLLDEVCAYAKSSGESKVTLNDIKKVISERTGIPIEDISSSDLEKLQNLEEILEKQVKGQNHAITKISRIIRRSRSGLKDPRRPIGSFLFLGPSGSGKTFLAKALTKVIYDDENSLVRIDMSEFGEAHNVQRLVGAPPGYVGYEEGGQLTNPVWERPYSLILLDEIEKAHPRVFDTFLQVIDEGRLTDGQGKTVDFNNTIIIATSNVGVDYLLQKYSDIKDEILSEEFLQAEMIPILLTYFRPEFINRFDEIIIFSPLSSEELYEIAKLEIHKLNERLKDRNIEIEVSENSLTDLTKNSYDPKFGARILKRNIREQIEDLIAEKIVFGEINNNTKITI